MTPVVASFLGVGLLGEKLSAGAAAALILIAAGGWLAIGRQPAREQISAGTDDQLAEGNDT